MHGSAVFCGWLLIKDIQIPGYDDAKLHLLKLSEEVDLIKAITRFPEVVEGAAKSLEPHRLTFYLSDVAALLHSYYNKYKVLSEDEGHERGEALSR